MIDKIKTSDSLYPHTQQHANNDLSIGLILIKEFQSISQDDLDEQQQQMIMMIFNH